MSGLAVRWEVRSGRLRCGAAALLSVALTAATGCPKATDAGPAAPEPAVDETPPAEPDAGTPAPPAADAAAVEPQPEEPVAAAAPDAGSSAPPRQVVTTDVDGRVTIGRPEIARGGGRISGGLFHRAIERKHGGLVACYNAALVYDPELEGSLVLVMVVDTQGMVGVRVETDDEALAAAGVTSCAAQKLRQVSFENTPPSSELWIRVPLEFEP
jgi:hypothetical protein